MYDATDVLDRTDPIARRVIVSAKSSLAPWTKKRQAAERRRLADLGLEPSVRCRLYLLDGLWDEIKRRKGLDNQFTIPKILIALSAYGITLDDLASEMREAVENPYGHYKNGVLQWKDAFRTASFTRFSFEQNLRKTSSRRDFRMPQSLASKIQSCPFADELGTYLDNGRTKPWKTWILTHAIDTYDAVLANSHA